MIIRVLSVDPALRNVGLCYGGFNTETGEFRPVKLKLVTTEAGKAKTVRKNSDDLRRARELNEAIEEFLGVADLVIAEIPTGTQSARGSVSNGMMIGLLATIKKPLIEVTPTEAKLVATGRKNASKDEMIQWAFKAWPGLQWLRARGSATGNLVDANEHLADACAIALAGFKTEQFKALRVLFQRAEVPLAA